MKHTKQIQISLTQIARVYPDEHPTNPNDMNDEIIIIYKRGDRTIEHPNFNLQDIRNYIATRSADNETKSIYGNTDFDDYKFFPINISGNECITLSLADIYRDIHGYACLLNYDGEFFGMTKQQAEDYQIKRVEEACKEMAAYSNGEMYRVEIINLETCSHCNHTKEEVENNYGSFIDEAAAVEFIETNFLIL